MLFVLAIEGALVCTAVSSGGHVVVCSKLQGRVEVGIREEKTNAQSRRICR